MTKLRKPEDNTPQDIQIEGSSGNVFADLGFENADEELLKAQLAHVIGSLLEARGAKQVKAAALLGTTQPKVSNLLRGRTEAFSVQKLFDFLNRLDQDVVVGVRPKPTSQSRGRTSFIPVDRLAALAVATTDFGYAAATLTERGNGKHFRMAKAGAFVAKKSARSAAKPLLRPAAAARKTAAFKKSLTPLSSSRQRPATGRQR